LLSGHNSKASHPRSYFNQVGCLKTKSKITQIQAWVISL